MKGVFKIAGLLGMLGGLVFLERRRPLRAERESKTRRTARKLQNLAICCAPLHPCFLPLVFSLSSFFPESSLSLACLASAFSIPRWPFALAVVSACLMRDGNAQFVTNPSHSDLVSQGSAQVGNTCKANPAPYG